MSIKATPYKAIKKAVKVTKAVVAGYADYSEKMHNINMAAEKKLRPTFGNSSTGNDAQRVHKEMRTMKQEQGVSLRGSIRSKLGL